MKHFFIRLFQKFALNNRYKALGYYKQLPENITPSQAKVIQIFKEMLYNPKSKLSYNNKKQIACIKLETEDDNLNPVSYTLTIYDDYVTIINTVHSYDEHITEQIHSHLMWLFYNKENRIFMKNIIEANKKVNNSLSVILNKVKNNK